VSTWSLVYAGAGEHKGLSRLSQKAWDVEAARVSFASLMNGADQVSKARLLSAATKESG